MAKPRRGKPLVGHNGVAPVNNVLVASQKKPVSPMVLVRGRIRDDFRRRAVKAALDWKRPGNFVGFETPLVREHAFAKAPGKTIRGISRRKWPNKVRSASLSRSDKFIMHTHVGSPKADVGVGDFFRYVRGLRKAGKLTKVIEFVDTGWAEVNFATRLEMDVETAGKQLSRQELAEHAKRAARRAAKEIVPAGRVLIAPTKKFQGLGEQKYLELCHYLKQAAAEERRIAKTMSINEERPKILAELRTKARRHITSKYGKIFAFKYVAMPGYTYDKKQGKFVVSKR
ncbi:MAG: hypothetical protein JW744_00770 [Candidatus Diapherotrites archaeon]|uniref:Uncharacterized protein n=1 Tax=Candidatus Iainarchaeum sp. TaxID=3101447 RepID=A0A938YMM7_9ARCH|nr:hypothetical protein [Candidatus Diapherotrites archaeon]